LIPTAAIRRKAAFGKAVLRHGQSSKARDFCDKDYHGGRPLGQAEGTLSALKRSQLWPSARAHYRPVSHNSKGGPSGNGQASRLCGRLNSGTTRTGAMVGDRSYTAKVHAAGFEALRTGRMGRGEEDLHHAKSSRLLTRFTRARADSPSSRWLDCRRGRIGSENSNFRLRMGANRVIWSLI
jgi:hypothetical protein